MDIFFKQILVLKNLWARLETISEKLGYGSEFRKMPGSGSSFSEFLIRRVADVEPWFFLRLQISNIPTNANTAKDT
jgi:hypothetical protein